MIGATNIQTGELERFSIKNDTDHDEAIKILLATSAIPVVFPPRVY